MKPITKTQGLLIDNAILLFGTLSGLLAEDKVLWYTTFVKLFLFIVVALFSVEGIMLVLCKQFGKKIQVNGQTPRYMWEVLEELRFFWTTSFIVSWCLYRFYRGDAPYYTWNPQESTLGTSIIAHVGFFIFFCLFVDVYTYWQHRFLHTKNFFIFHKQHHSFVNPSTFASFSTSPFEALITFLPAWIDLLPFRELLVTYIPYHLSLVAFMTVLNVYLHCGYTFDFIESIFPKIMLISSGFHNPHHSKGKVHFSELLTLWDYLMNTGATYYNKSQFDAVENKFMKAQ